LAEVSTNFYVRVKGCKHCGRYEEVHMGKRALGWTFLFRGYSRNDDDFPFNVYVKSRQGWIAFFKRYAGQVELWDQYGRHYADPVAFLEDLTAPDAEQLAKEKYQETLSGTHRYSRAHPDRTNYRDKEGFRVSEEYFC
jgi:hypothetical protein